jgi:hypothetical protein
MSLESLIARAHLHTLIQQKPTPSKIFVDSFFCARNSPFLH